MRRRYTASTAKLHRCAGALVWEKDPGKISWESGHPPQARRNGIALGCCMGLLLFSRSFARLYSGIELTHGAQDNRTRYLSRLRRIRFVSGIVIGELLCLSSTIPRTQSDLKIVCKNINLQHFRERGRASFFHSFLLRPVEEVEIGSHLRRFNVLVASSAGSSVKRRKIDFPCTFFPSNFLFDKVGVNFFLFRRSAKTDGNSAEAKVCQASVEKA